MISLTRKDQWKRDYIKVELMNLKLCLILMLGFGVSLLSYSKAKDDESKEFLFEYTYTWNSQTGEYEDWRLLFDDKGSVVMVGSSLLKQPESELYCSSEAGEYRLDDGKKYRDKLIELVEGTIKEQKNLPPHEGGRHSVERRLNYLYGETDEAFRVSQPQKKKHSELEKYLLSIQEELKGTPTEGLKVEKISLEGNRIVLVLKNIGKVKTELILPEHANTTFHLIDKKGEKINLEYSVTPAKNQLVGTGKTVSVSFKKPKGDISKATLIYDNIRVLNHIPEDKYAMKVRLCGKL